MKKYTAFFILLLTAFSVWSQQQITGSVMDSENNTPLAGASISSGDQVLTSTDDQGMFKLDCTGPMEITISYVGYNPRTQKVANCPADLKIGLELSSTFLDEVELIAHSGSDKSLLDKPVSLVKLREVELKRATGLYLDDAINTNVPGVFMERRTISAGQQFNIRGYGNGLRGTNGINSNFDGQGTKVYLNGIPITDAEGITVMDDIDFSSLSNVDVLKGPSGSLYGLAIAGVVNLETKKAERNKIAVGQDFMVGSFGLLRSTTHLAVGGDKSSLMVNYGHQKFGGYMDHTASHKDFVNLMGDFRVSDKESITTYFGFSDSYDERNGELTIEQYDSLDYSGNPAYIKNNAHSAVQTFRAGIGHKYLFNKHISNTTTFFGTAQNINNSSAGGWTDKSPLNFGLRSTVDMSFSLSESFRLKGVVGVEMQKMNALTVGYRMEADSTNLTGYNVVGDIRSIQATSSGTASYFTQWTAQLPLNIDVTAGVGFSTMALSLQDRLWSGSNNVPGNTTPQEYKTSYDGLISPNVSVNKKFGSNFSVYASYSVGYKAPVSSYFYIPTTGEVNQGLKPEKGSQIEVGAKGSLMDNRLFFTVAAFNAQFSDKMTAVTVQNPANTATLYSYIVNGGSLNNTGVELLVKYEVMKSRDGFIKSLRPFANLTWSNFKYVDFQYEKVGKGSANQDSTLVFDYSGNSVAGVPPIVFNLGVDLETRLGLYGNVNFNYRGAMYFTSDEANITDPYYVLNAKVGYVKSFGPLDLNVYAGANNLTSSQFYYMVFLNQLPDAYLPAPLKINFFGGVNLKYNF
ncbi:MAG: TonB-dependent receptor [Bacteroidia bacterium]|nr:TonB-dependent receptor [Bacteroidia bacterium]